MSTPTSAELEYIERVARLFEDSGQSRIAGRIFAWLMICDPLEQSQPELAAALGASKASISTEVRALIGYGLVERTSKPGERRSYYRIPEDGWATLLERRARIIAKFRQAAVEGLELLEGAPARRRARLVSMRRTYTLMGRALESALGELRAATRARKKRRR